jgi:putative spermidine/putrescine transport system substrate-binding protein
MVMAGAARMRVFAVLAVALAAAAPPAHGIPPSGKPAPSAAKPGAPAAAKPAAPPGATGPAPLLVAIPPDAPADTLRKFLLKPYADVTGTNLAGTSWDGATLEGLKQTTPDLALVSGGQLAEGCKAQFFAKLDWDRLERDRYVPSAVSPCGVGAYLGVTALAWDGDKPAAEAAPDWSAFWDVARRPGRRGLPRTARGNLEIALLADGVSAGDIYRTLRAPDGLDRAFRKLDQLKPYIIWWDQAAQAAQLLTGGKVLFIAAPAAAVQQAGDARHHVGVQWGASLSEWRFWAVPAAAPHPQAAALALLLAGDPGRQAMFAQAGFLGPSEKDALALLSEAARMANPAAHLEGMLAIDEGFWAENREKLEARFSAWLAK